MTYFQLKKLCEEFNMEIGTLKLYYNNHLAANFSCEYISPTISEFFVSVSYIHTNNYYIAKKALFKRIQELKLIEIKNRLISFEKDFV